jgi:hypothetical protein
MERCAQLHGFNERKFSGKSRPATRGEEANPTELLICAQRQSGPNQLLLNPVSSTQVEGGVRPPQTFAAAYALQHAYEMDAMETDANSEAFSNTRVGPTASKPLQNQRVTAAIL